MNLDEIQEPVTVSFSLYKKNQMISFKWDFAGRNVFINVALVAGGMLKI